jgi:hypothetical protein
VRRRRPASRLGRRIADSATGRGRFRGANCESGKRCSGGCGQRPSSHLPLFATRLSMTMCPMSPRVWGSVHQSASDGRHAMPAAGGHLGPVTRMPRVRFVGAPARRTGHITGGVVRSGAHVSEHGRIVGGADDPDSAAPPPNPAARTSTTKMGRLSLRTVFMSGRGAEQSAIRPANDPLMVLTVADRRPGGVVGHR